MSARDFVYLGHMLDMARKAVAKTRDLSREEYDADENLRLRHKVVHDYLGVDEDIVWQVVPTDLPKLVSVIEPLVPPAL